MKIKEVCGITGLSERSIRFYIEKGLISPAHIELNDRVYYDYADSDVQEIEQVATLRRLGFPIASILAMKSDARQIDEVVLAYRKALEETAIKRADAMKALEKTASREYKSLGELTCDLMGDAVSHELPTSDIWPNFAQFDPETPEEKERAYDRFLAGRKRKDKRARTLKALKAVLLCVSAAAVLFGAVYGVSFIPRRVQKEYSGIELRLNGEGSEFIQTTDIRIDGWMYEPFFDVPRFEGAFEVSAYPLTISSELELYFLKEDGYVIYDDKKNGEPGLLPFGLLFTDKHFSSVAIQLFDTIKQQNGSADGSFGDRVIAAPAGNMDAAYEVLRRQGVFWMDYKGVWIDRD